jgi:hypothetical protein
MDGQETCPLPEDPALAEAAVALNDARAWAHIVDQEWRWVYMTDDVRLSLGDGIERIPVPLGRHYFGPETTASEVYGRSFRPETTGRQSVAELGPWLLADTPGGRAGLRDVLDPAFHDLVDAIEPDDRSIVRSFPLGSYTVAGGRPRSCSLTWRGRRRSRVACPRPATSPPTGPRSRPLRGRRGRVGRPARGRWRRRVLPRQ